MPNSTKTNVKPEKSSVSLELVLLKAFDKLTSQVFIFLLAYTLLLVIVVVKGSQMPAEFRLVLTVIPLLGVVGFIWLRHMRLRTESSSAGISVQAGEISDSASVAGVRGAQSPDYVPENVNVSVKHGSGHANIVGVEYETVSRRQDDSQENQLIQLFRNLPSSERNALLDHAIQLNQVQSS